MKKYLLILLLVVYSNILCNAEDIYSELGIATPQNQETLTEVPSDLDILKCCKLKKIYKKRLSKLLKYIKSQKISKDMTHYGVGIDYKISKEIQITIDILAELDMKKPSNMLKDNRANIRLAISL